jgi:hypothetical protein
MSTVVVRDVKRVLTLSERAISTRGDGNYQPSREGSHRKGAGGRGYRPLEPDAARVACPCSTGACWETKAFRAKTQHFYPMHQSSSEMGRQGLTLSLRFKAVMVQSGCVIRRRG